jgi:serine/threonine protein kinase
MIGETISHYKLLSQIGEGGMGIVYLGEQTNLNRKVAIKELNSGLTENPQFKERFINEARILAKLSHPNIVTVYDLISDGGRFFIVMEYIIGENVSEYIIRNRAAFELKRCINIFKHILSAFSYAHSEGIIHRDIKPSNIILQQNDVPKILDFGIAKITNLNMGMTKTGTKMGSVFYMSPEQVMGENVDKRTDVYSLGITLFEMLTGSLPFNVDTDSEYKVQTKIVNEPLPSVRYYNPRLPEQIDLIIAKATAKRIQDRFSGCEEFYYALENNFTGISAPVSQKTVYSGNQAGTGNQRPDATRQVAFQPQPAQSYQNKTVAVSPPVQSAPRNYPAGKKKTNPLVYILPIVFVFLIVGGIGIYYLFFMDDTKPPFDDKLNKNAKLDVNDELKQKEDELKKREKEIEDEMNQFKDDAGKNNGSGSERRNSSVPGLYPEGSTRYLTDGDLIGKSRYDLKIMRNEIFARHGYIFKSNPDMVEYFNNQSWYTPRYYDVTSMLSNIEQANVKKIQTYEK